VRDGRPLLEGGRVLPVGNVIWCTGFDPGFSWIDLPVFDADGQPKQERGVVVGEPGLYFVGLHFLYALSSTMIHGVGRDADRVAAAIAERVRAAAVEKERRPAPQPDAPELAARAASRGADPRVPAGARGGRDPDARHA